MAATSGVHGRKRSFFGCSGTDVLPLSEGDHEIVIRQNKATGHTLEGWGMRTVRDGRISPQQGEDLTRIARQFTETPNKQYKISRQNPSSGRKSEQSTKYEIQESYKQKSNSLKSSITHCHSSNSSENYFYLLINSIAYEIWHQGKGSHT